MEIFDALQVVWDSFRVEGLAHDEEAFLRIIDTGRCYVKANLGHLVCVHRDHSKKVFGDGTIANGAICKFFFLVLICHQTSMWFHSIIEIDFGTLIPTQDNLVH